MMPKRRTKNLFPISVYNTVQYAAHSKHNLSSKNSKHIVPIAGRFLYGGKEWVKTMYLNLNDLAAYRSEILELMREGMNSYHDKANKKVVYSAKQELGDLERKVRGCIQVENKKKGLHQDIIDTYYTKSEKLKRLEAEKKLEELKEMLD